MTGEDRGPPRRCAEAPGVRDPALQDSCNLLPAGRLAEVDATCSRFRDDSELAALDSAEGRPVRVSLATRSSARARSRARH